MKTAALLKKNKIANVLIVDDGFDLAPRLSELGATNADWATFFDDMTFEDEKLLQETYPIFDLESSIDYSKDETFLHIVWKLRKKLSKEAVTHILSTYETSQNAMLSVLTKAEKSLKSYGLKVSKAGRDFVDAVATVDLILIDLYLGAQHDPEDMNISIDGLKLAISKRQKNPPAIILMSSHPNISSKRAVFRDEAGVFASGFRAIKKAEIVLEGRLDQLLFELASHRQDSLKLTNFLEVWQEGILRSMEATSDDIRRMDLEDIAQLHNLLLDDEQELRGSYMLDLVDRLLLHEVESDKPTIAAAKKLNSMDSGDHPPNTMTDSKDNLGLVHKTLYVHQNRRALDPLEGYPVGFGDIIALKEGAKAPPGSIFSGAQNSVFAVMTPACDLIREPPKAKRVLLLEGECKSVDAVAYSPPMPNDSGPRTIVLQHGNTKVGVEWKPKKLATLTKIVMKNLLGKDEIFVAGRLRSEFALELQQAMLSGVGRVGVMAPMPSNYPIIANVYYPDKDRNFVLLKTSLHGMCVVGRAANKKTVRIGFDSSQRHDFTDELRAAFAKIHQRSRDRIRTGISLQCVNALFAEGFICDLTKASTKNVPCKPRLGATDQQIGVVVYGLNADTSIQDPGQRQSAGLVFEINENRCS